MTRVRRYVAVAVVGGLGLAATAVAVSAQQMPRAAVQAPRLPQAEPPAGLSLAELQRWLDAYVSMQAQEALGLTDEQYPPFLQRLRAMQTIKRKHLQARALIIQQLSRMAGPRAGVVDESALAERLQALDDLEARFGQDLRQACAAIEGVLDVRQRARFRVFEDQMERRKLDLWARARRGVAGRRGGIG